MFTGFWSKTSSQLYFGQKSVLKGAVLPHLLVTEYFRTGKLVTTSLFSISEGLSSDNP